jgi:cyclopropane fatty-acyl-phospholipid synthase-like methyltransferase
LARTKTPWEEFFDHHAPVYMQNGFTGNTLAEVDFLIELLALPAGCSVLDMGCGTGRHSIELARRGFSVTGVDLSEGMLNEARKTAEAAGVTVEWIQEDATQYRGERRFDAAICLCEGAFGLIGPQESGAEHDLAILRSVRRALKPDSPFLLTALNGLRIIRQFTQEDVERGRFDPLTMTEVDESLDLPEGLSRLSLRQRCYVPTELIGLCEVAGFTVEHLWGGTAGRWGRRTLDLDEIEVMIVARKVSRNQCRPD